VLCAFLAGCGASLNDQAGGGLAPESASAISKGSSAIESPGATKPVRMEGADVFTVSATGSAAYKIGPLDVLDVSVFKVPELSRSVQVADNGTISLPLVGEVPVAGRTARDVEHDLSNKLGDQYLQAPQVTVFVKEFNSRRVTVEGAVRKPGVYPIRGKTTLLQFISIAQGVTEASETDNILVFRTVDDKRSAAKFDLDEIRAGRAADPEIADGDIIVVNTSATKAAFQNFLRVLPTTAAFVPLL